MKDVYYENYETLMKEVEDDTKKWKDIPCSWTGRINIVKILPRATTDLCNPYHNSHDIFHKTRRNNPKIYTEPKISQIAKIILR